MDGLDEIITREQAEEFVATLWPCGHMSHLDNPTRTFLAALIGHVPQGLPYSEGDPALRKVRRMARILRLIADHLEVSGETAGRAALAQQNDGGRG